MEWKKSEAGTKIGARWYQGKGGEISTYNPTNGEKLCAISQIDKDLYAKLLTETHEEFLKWRSVPAPRRGELVRRLGDEIRAHKETLARVISLEMGKIYPEALGEIQEAIDICDYAVGLSRQLYGVTTKSERPSHKMYEQWHPLGINGFITAFNFPIAVWAWNAMISAVCGNTMIWKPSSKTPLCAIMVHKVIQPILDEFGYPNLMNLAIGGSATLGEWLNNDRRIPLISATGSCRMGKRIGEVVAGRFGRVILELGGNNGIIVSPHANLDLAVRAVLFGAVGTTGQRCTSTRRLFLHRSIVKKFVGRLLKSYESLVIGDPLTKGTHVGPLVDHNAVEDMLKAIGAAKSQGGKILYGGEKLTGGKFDKGHFVRPCLIMGEWGMPVAFEETFAPILYIFEYEDFHKVIEQHNSVSQGLSSAIFTDNLLEAEFFLSEAGSDCGIANVNIGTSGAEIGLAFGGEKDTGGGREAGSDSWKIYMRRQTNTINYGKDLPLAQGVKFEV